MVVIEESIVKDEPMNKDFVEQVALSCGKSKDFFGENINEKEQEDATDRLKKYREEQEQALNDSEGKVSTLTSENSILKANISALTTARDSYKAQAEDLTKKLASPVEENTDTESNETSKVVSIDDFTLAQLAGAFFRKIIKF